MLARADVKVVYSNGKKSKLGFHSMPDGAAIIPLDTGYGKYTRARCRHLIRFYLILNIFLILPTVYVSNSEVDGGKGGVFGLYFDDNDNIVDYKQLLAGTTRNCSGGKCNNVLYNISSPLMHVVSNQSSLPIIVAYLRHNSMEHMGEL